MSKKFVVIGGDAAGLSAASKAKRENPELDVTVFEKGEWISYGACGLPYYVKDEIKTLNDLVTLTPEEVNERGIDLRVNQKVKSIDPENQVVNVEAENDNFEQSYDQLLIATGARAREPPIEGSELEGMFKLHRLPSAEKLRKYIKSSDSPETVGIIGGGYLGIEMAEAFAAHGLDIHIFEMLPRILNLFHEDISKEIEEHLQENDVTVHTDTEVERITGENGRVESIQTEEDNFKVDTVLIAAGVTPNVELAEEAGIKTGPTGAIETDEYGRTNYQDIYAAGDCSESTNVVTKTPDYVPLALTANREGRSIGSTVAGSPTKLNPIACTSKIKAFELEVATTGVSDHERAKSAGFNPITQTITASSRAHYYPGGYPIKVSMTADKDSGKVLGASIVGKEGATNRIGTVATALHADLTVSEVEGLDQGYAPPFGPVWDPILTVAKVLNGKI